MAIDEALKLIRAACVKNGINPNQIESHILLRAAQELQRVKEAEPSNVVGFPTTGGISISLALRD